ncbi:MAG TPA: ABC transporter family substrate-binding protein [Candidatus Nocardiopsis merdipullorum]|nr:ABC transporter family substrate-binding protein [Candidatus Nocardiopsis merdipullorum]
MRIRRKMLALAAVATSTMMVASACGSGGDADGNGEKEVTWVVSDVPGAWQATHSLGGSVYTVQMLAGTLPYLGTWLPDGSTYEWQMDYLAEEPEVLNDDLDEGPFEYQIVLSDDAVWSDGEPMTGDDLRATWMMFTSPEEGHCDGCEPRAAGPGYDNIEEIEVDGKTATVRLKEGFTNPEWQGDFGAHNMGGGFYPAHIAEEQGWDIDEPSELGEYFEWLHAERPEWSGGPYIITEGDLNTEVVKEPNPEWFGDEPNLDRITMQFNTDEGTYVNALQNGEIDGASPSVYNTDIITQLEDLPDVDLSIAEGSVWEHVDLNLENEWLEDVELRRAIFTAIDRQEIADRNFAETYPEIELKNNHIFGNDSEYFVDHYEGDTQGTGDIEAAIEILEDADYELDGDTLTLDGDEVGPFRLRATDSDVRNNSMQLIQAQLAEIGIEANIEPTDDLGATTEEGDYDIMQFGWQGTPDFITSPNQFWHSSSGSNYGGYANDEVDELTNDVINSLDLDEAAENANAATEIVVSEAYVLPLMAEPYYYFADDHMVNVEDNTHSSYRATYNIGEWDIAD